MRPVGTSGLTLVELLVALVVSGILASTVLQVYGRYHRLSLFLVADYHQESSNLLLQMRQVLPVKRKIPGPWTED